MESDELRPYTREKELSRAQTLLGYSVFQQETGSSIYEYLLNLTSSGPVLSATKMLLSLVQTAWVFWKQIADGTPWSLVVIRTVS